MLHFSRKARADLILLPVIAIAAVKFTYGIDTISDLAGFDETDYLMRGVRLRGPGGPLAFGGLYAVWYYLLSLIEPDRIQLYYLNYKVLVTATTVLFYLLLRGLGVNSFFAALASSFYLVSNIPQASPYIMLFALLVMLLFLNWAIRLSSDENFYLVAGLGILLMSFIRAEYTVALILLFGISLPLHYVSSSSARGSLNLMSVAKIIIFLVTGVILFYFFGNPLGSDRAWEAFGQHFHIHYVDWYGADNVMDWEASRTEAFGEASSIAHAVMLNSTLFARHVLENAGTLPLAMITMPFVTPFPFLSPHIQSVLAWIQLSIFIGVGVLLGRTALMTPQPTKHIVRRRFLVVCVIVCFPNIISALVIYPRWHYVVIPIIVMLSLFWAFVSAATKDTFPNRMKVREDVLAIALLLVIPNLANGWLPALTSSGSVEVGAKLEREKQVLQSRFSSSFPLWSTVANYWLPRPFAEYEEGERVLENRSVIHFIRSLNIVSNVNILAGQGYSNYLPANYVPVHPWEKDDSFAKFLQDRQIGMILVQEFLLTHPNFVNDIEFHDFLEKFDSHGFLEIEIPGAQWSLLVKGVLLEQRSNLPKSDSETKEKP